MIEKPAVEEAPSRCAVLGRYIITPDVFEVLRSYGTGEGRRNTAYRRFKVMAGREAVFAYNFEGKRYDVGG